MRAYLVLLVVIASAFTLGLVADRGTVIVGVYFYSWYSADGRHWNGSIDPTWSIVEKPVIGFYDSRDEYTIRWQLKLIRDAGVDFIIISWWGPGRYEDEVAKVVV